MRIEGRWDEKDDGEILVDVRTPVFSVSLGNVTKKPLSK